MSKSLIIRLALVASFVPMLTGCGIITIIFGPHFLDDDEIETPYSTSATNNSNFNVVVKVSGVPAESFNVNRQGGTASRSFSRSGSFVVSVEKITNGADVQLGSKTYSISDFHSSTNISATVSSSNQVTFSP